MKDDEMSLKVSVIHCVYIHTLEAMNFLTYDFVTCRLVTNILKADSIKLKIEGFTSRYVLAYGRFSDITR